LRLLGGPWPSVNGTRLSNTEKGLCRGPRRHGDLRKRQRSARGTGARDGKKSSSGPRSLVVRHHQERQRVAGGVLSKDWPGFEGVHEFLIPAKRQGVMSTAQGSTKNEKRATGVGEGDLALSQRGGAFQVGSFGAEAMVERGRTGVSV